MKIIDTHTHLYLEEFDLDRREVIQAAKTVGVGAVLLPNIDVSTIQPLLELCKSEPGFAYPMMGLHPTSVDASYTAALKEIELALQRDSYCAIGEIGIDLYWDSTYLKEQRAAFEEQLRWSLDLELPVSIHTRNAYHEVFESIYKVGAEKLIGVFHCFSGTADDLEIIKKMPGFKIGINGSVTYKKSSLSDVLKNASIEMLVLETDAPYLSPTPYRGKRNEPLYIWETAKVLASIFDVGLDEMGKQTTANAAKIFTKVCDF